MFESKYKEEMAQITPSKDLINRTKTAMKAELETQVKEPTTLQTKRPKIFQPTTPPKRNRQIYRRIVTFAAAAAILVFAVFEPNMFNRNDNVSNPFIMRVYAMELQPDGTYVRQEIDITRLYGWGEHYDGEVLHIGLGLWFAFEGENIKTVEFSLENGFFSTQFIGNRGDVPNTTSWHIDIPPDFTVSRLVMYGDVFDKVGSVISFGSTMPNDILLFWSSYNISINEWLQGDRVIEIDVMVTFEGGETQTEQIILDFGDGWGVGWFDAGLLSDADDYVFLDWFTNEQLEFVETAPLEHFTHLPDALKELPRNPLDMMDEQFRFAHLFSIEGYKSYQISIGMWVYDNGLGRMPMGVSGDYGFIVNITKDDDGNLNARAYSIRLN